MSMRKICKLFCIIFVLLVPIVFSTAVVKLNLTDMTAKADYIGKGMVEKKYSQWDDTKTKIYTYTVIKMNKNYKGNANKVVVKILGGLVDDIGMRVPGQVKFNENEEVLLFLEKKREDIASINKNLGISNYEAKHISEYEIVGFSQGKFSIKEENRKKVVTNDESFELELVTPQGVVKKEFEVIPLEDFEKQIYNNLGYKEKQDIIKLIKTFILKIFSFLR